MPRIDLAELALHTNTKNVVVAGIREEEYPHQIAGQFSEFRHIYIAPPEPTYNLKKLQTWLEGLIPSEIPLSKKEEFSYDRGVLHVGTLFVDEGEKRAIIRGYPDRQTAEGVLNGKHLEYEIKIPKSELPKYLAENLFILSQSQSHPCA